MFLDSAEQDTGSTSPRLTTLTELLKRRPDIGNIRLDCENANTVLPYIDLANEVLENAVAPRSYTRAVIETDGRSITVFSSADVPQTDETRVAALRASPEHLNPDAYDTLEEAEYPWSLPFSLAAAEARTYLRQLGVRRDELMQAMQSPSGPSPSESEVLGESLGLTPIERSLLTTRATDFVRLRSLWGVSAGDLPAALATNASFFADRAQSSYTPTSKRCCNAGSSTPIRTQLAH